MLHRSGCDPDFSATKRFQIDVQPLIDTLVEKSRAEEERRLVEVTQKLEEAIASKQEAEAKLQHAENKIKELEQGTAARPGGSVSLNKPIVMNFFFKYIHIFINHVIYTYRELLCARLRHLCLEWEDHCRHYLLLFLAVVHHHHLRHLCPG